MASEQQIEATLWNRPTTWQAYCDLARQNEGLTQKEQQYICSGLVVLAQVLGDNFLQRVFSLNLPKVEERHPLVLLANGTPSAQLSLGRLGETLKVLEGVTHFRSLVKFLKDARSFNSAVAHIEVAARLQSAGYEIVDLEPKVRNGKADVLARKNGEEFFIEVSTVGGGRKKEEYPRETAHAIWTPILVSGCIPAGRIYRIISEEDRAKYQGEIKKIIEEVKTKGRCLEIEHKGALDIFIALRDKGRELDICLQGKGLEHGCVGPPLTKDQIRSVIERFGEEISQLPEDKPSVVTVYANDLTPFYVQRDQVLEEVASGMESTMTNKDNIILFVLIVPEGCFETQNKYKRYNLSNSKTVVQRPFVRECRETILAVKNMNARFSCPSGILSAFLDVQRS